MNLKNLSNETLLSQTKLYVQKEREMTLQVLHHLREVERRRLFASLGYSSLFDYVTRELGYCAASACRRIDAMRLLKELPELEDKIQVGALTLSTVARAQSFFKKEPIPETQKKELMTKLENKSTRQVEKELLSLTSSPEAHFQERIKPVTPRLSEVKFYASDELLESLEKRSKPMHLGRSKNRSEMRLNLSPSNGSRAAVCDGWKDPSRKSQLLCSQHNLYEAERYFGPRPKTGVT